MRVLARSLAVLATAATLTLGVTGSALAADAQPLGPVIAIDSTDAPAAGQAWVRVLHGSPDAPAVDVYVDGAQAITALAFGKISDYTPVPAGNHAVKVCATGSTTVCPIDVASLAVADGVKYTIAATGALAAITAQVLVDAPAAATADTTQIRVVHFSADTPAVDVFAGDAKIVDNLAYPTASAYLAVPGGAYSVKVCAHADNTICPIGPAQLTFEGGKAYSVFAVGSLSALPSAAETAMPGTTMPPTDTVRQISGPAGTTSGLDVLLVAGLAFVLASLLIGVRFASGPARD